MTPISPQSSEDEHWDCRAVRESIASVKKGMFEAVADMVMRTARGILAQGDDVPLQLAFSSTIPTSSFWLEHMRTNVENIQEDFQNAVWGTLRWMFGPSIEWKVPRIDTIKASISWLVSLQDR